MGKKFLYLFNTIIILLVFLCGCSANKIEKFDCSGVLLYNGEPLSNVEVLVNDESCCPKIYSDKYGKFNIPNLAKNDIISFNKKNYFCERKIIVNANIHEIIDFSKEDNTVNIETSVSNIIAGKITTIGKIEYGKSATIEVTANKGYKYLGIFENQNLITDNTTYRFIANKNQKLCAKFEKLYWVNFSIFGNGQIENKNQYFSKYDTIKLNAKNENFLYWEINGKKFNCNQICDYIVSGKNYNIKITAVFKEKLEKPKLNIDNENIEIISDYNNFNVYIDGNLLLKNTTIKNFNINDIFHVSNNYIFEVEAIGYDNFSNSDKIKLNIDYKKPIDAVNHLSWFCDNNKTYLTFKGSLAANLYKIYINQTQFDFVPNKTEINYKIDISNYLNKIGDYKIYVKSFNSDSNLFSNKSKEIIYTKYEKTKTPIGKIKNGNLEITNYDFNSRYKIYINNVFIIETNNQVVDLKKYFIKNIEYKIKIQSLKKGDYYQKSDNFLISYIANEN